MIIKKTEAAVLFESHAPLKLVEIDLPEELEAGQVLVELITSGICGAQINEIDAVKGPDKFLPHLLGHEGLAKVLEVGPGVSKLVPGDEVVMHWRPSTGIVAKTPKYRFENRTVNAGWVTTFNRHAVVSENRLTKIQIGSSDKYVLPLLGCALTTALGVLENDAKFSSRDSLLIFGLGGVGVSLILFAKFLRARKIVVVDIDARKKLFAEKLGVDKFIQFNSKDQTIRELEAFFGANLPNLAIDTSGKSTSIEICYEITSDLGRVILVGVPNISDKSRIYTLPLHFGKVLTGSKGGDSIPDKDIPFIIELLKTSELDVSNFPVTKISFDKINEGIDFIRSGINGRVVIDFGSQV
jgi:Zn-dependent alcohol dehydrogenase